MNIGDVFECEDGIFPKEAMALCKDGKAYIEEVEPIVKMVEEELLVALPVYDENGELVSGERYETKQVEKTIRRFQIVAVPEPTAEELAKQAIAQAKAERSEEVEALTVEVEGMIFDADETSQARMSVAASSMTDDETNVWVLHDNSVVQVTKAQLLLACRLARIAQSAVWTKPYENASA